MNDAARQARNQYASEWRKKNPDKVRQAHARYWAKKAEQAAEPAANPDTEPAADPDTEPAADPDTEPAADPDTEAVLAPGDLNHSEPEKKRQSQPK